MGEENWDFAFVLFSGFILPTSFFFLSVEHACIEGEWRLWFLLLPFVSHTSIPIPIFWALLWISLSHIDLSFFFDYLYLEALFTKF